MARDCLLNESYSTSVPYEIEDETLIRKVELVYRSSALEKMLMPYYCFYVESPDYMPKENGPTTFGVYYVYNNDLADCSESGAFCPALYITALRAYKKQAGIPPVIIYFLTLLWQPAFVHDTKLTIYSTPISYGLCPLLDS